MGTALKTLRREALKLGLGFTDVMPNEIVLELEESRIHFLESNDDIVVTRKNETCPSTFRGTLLYKAPAAWVRFNAQTSLLHCLQRILSSELALS